MAELSPSVAEGIALHQAGRLADAERVYRRILEREGASSDALQLLGVTLLQRGNHAEAIRYFDAALARNPEDIAALSNRAVTLLELRRLDEALADCDRALALAPDHVTAWNNRGRILIALDRPEDALGSYEKAMAVRPDQADAFRNHGDALNKRKRFAEAVASYDKAVALAPDDAEVLNNRSVALMELNRLDEALVDCEKALALKPDYVDAHTNRGRILAHRKQLDEAFTSYPRAQVLRPTHVDSYLNAGIHRPFTQPPWRASDDISGKTILLHAEQGLGDTIMFCRYVPMVAERGAKVILEVQPPLTRLLSSLAGAHTIVGKGEPLPPFDAHCPLPSLPHEFATRLATIPPPARFAIPSAVARTWEARLGPKTKPRIGLAWSGSAALHSDHNRSIGLRRMLSLRELPVALISLQREVRREDESELAAQASGIAHFGDELTDFMETAALVSALDLVITVDTAVAHLACSLGRPTWILLPATPDWRWLLDREDSPWYPTARLFRQEQAGDWDPVLRRVAGELGRLRETVRADVPERRPDPVSPDQKPDAGALVAEGLAHHRGGRLTQAELLYRQAFELAPNNFEALHMLGVISHQRGDHVEALRRIDAALSGRSRTADSASAHAEAFSNRSVVLRELYRFDEALASCERAIALKPDYAAAFDNRGVALAELGRLEEALASCERAIALEPNAAGPLNSRGTILHALRRFPEAFASYERAQALQPDFVDAHWNEALGRLLSGDFARGWEKFEWRWKTAAMRGANAHLTQPEWDGNGDVAGKTVLLHAEQGFGDTIQFARYVPMVAERGAKVILQVQPALKRLLSQIEGAHAVLGRGEVLPPSDLHCPLLGLPRVFATRLDSIPPLRTPLRVPPELLKTWETRLGPKTRPRIGIAWTGNSARKYDRHRSIPLQQMLGLRDLPVQLVSLQKEMQVQDKDVLAALAPDVAHFGPAHTDFLETAALASLMDVVITVDTAVAHLAGSLGLPTWVLLPLIPDWRWLLDRDDSPWYPTVRLFRQPRAGDWDSVLKRVAGAWREGASKS